MDPTYRSVSLNMSNATSGYRLGSTSTYHYGSLITNGQGGGYHIALLSSSLHITHSKSCDFDDYEEVDYD